MKEIYFRANGQSCIYHQIVPDSNVSPVRDWPGDAQKSRVFRLRTDGMRDKKSGLGEGYNQNVHTKANKPLCTYSRQNPVLCYCV